MVGWLGVSLRDQLEKMPQNVFFLLRKRKIESAKWQIVAG